LAIGYEENLSLLGDCQRPLTEAEVFEEEEVRLYVINKRLM